MAKRAKWIFRLRVKSMCGRACSGLNLRPLMSSPIDRSTSRSRTSSPGRMGAMTCNVSGTGPSLYYEPKPSVDVYLIDGTYELFRHYYAVPSARDARRPRSRSRPRRARLAARHDDGEHHLHRRRDRSRHRVVPERLWAGYKTGEGIDPDLFAQFPLLEEMLTALGVAVWPMVEFEADDALAAAAARRRRIRVWTACSSARPTRISRSRSAATRVVQMDRRARTIRDEAGVIAEVRRPAGVDSRLPCAGRRRSRRLSRPGGLGRRIGGGRAGQVRTHRIDSRRLDDVARQRVEAGGARRHAGAGSRSRAALPRSRDASNRHPAVRQTWTSCDGTGRRLRSNRWPRVLTPRSIRPRQILCGPRED